jgi:hypothetical protein
MPRQAAALVSVCAVAVAAADKYRSKRALCSEDTTSRTATSIKWAHPSPYDEVVAPGRFADTKSLRSASRQVWDLPKLVDFWRNTNEEAWPWVWCDRNPVGPHHVFINVSEQTLALVAAISLADVRNNVTVVVSCEADLASAGITEQQLNAHRSAVIFVPLEQLDADNKILMLADERIIVYDFAYLA